MRSFSRIFSHEDLIPKRKDSQRSSSQECLLGFVRILNILAGSFKIFKDSMFLFQQ